MSSLRHLLILCISCVKSLWTTYGDFRLSDTSFADTELRKTGAISTLTKPILVGIYFRFYVYVYPFFPFKYIVLSLSQSESFYGISLISLNVSPLFSHKRQDIQGYLSRISYFENAMVYSSLAIMIITLRTIFLLKT